MMNNSSGCLIALSAGGDASELAAQGLGIEHVEELMVRISMKLLRDGHRLTFGGTLGDAKQALTQYLIHTAQSWLNEDSAKHIDITKPETWPLLNYSSWPLYTSISAEQRAQLVGICRFENVDPIFLEEDKPDELVNEWATKPRARMYAANALSTMRNNSSQKADLRIVWAGRIAGATGWMAGILEEVAYSLQFGKPTIILGGFGGCTRLLADFLAGENAPWPKELCLESCADAERDELLSRSEKQEVQDRFEKAKQQLRIYRTKLHSNPESHGINSRDIRDALLEESPRRIIRFVARAADLICKN